MALARRTRCQWCGDAMPTRGPLSNTCSQRCSAYMSKHKWRQKVTAQIRQMRDSFRAGNNKIG